MIAQGRADEARHHIERAKSLHPTFASSHEVFGDLMLLEDQFEQAIKSYQHSLQLAPGSSQLNAKINRTRDLIKAYGTGLPKNNMEFVEEITKAEEFKRDDEPAKAEKIYRDVLRRNPNHVEAIRLLAAVASKHRRYKDAEILLLRAVSLAPNYGRAWLDLSKTQIEQGKLSEAIKSGEELVKSNPDNAEPYIALANAQALGYFTAQAIENYRKALDISPGHPGAYSGLAHQLKTVGRAQEAIDSHRQNIAANPTNTDSYWNLANMKTFRFTDEEVKAMEQLLESDELEDLPITQLSNSLGLEYEGRKDYDRAFEHFQHGNDIRRQSEIYNSADRGALIESIIDVFSEQFLAQNQGAGANDPAPILIIGLPRSGSTLIEQILASHSQVEGTHELADLEQIMQAFKKPNSKRLPFPKSIIDLKQQAWGKIGNHYLERTQKYRSGMPRFIDKNPNNFIYVGLLHLILPKAKIINARRHPLDSCFGSYKQLFASGQPFSYDLTDLGEYYLQYQSIMDHWHQVLPGKVLDVNYADVVADLDTQVRRILDYCELPFEEECLRFHETERAVKTASSEQVRQPIYASSVNLWQHYESNLGELIDVLEPLLRDLPAADQPLSLSQPLQGQQVD